MNASIDVLTLFLFNIVLVNIPLLYGTVGEIVTEKAGSLNLGVEGTMAIGAIFGYLAGCMANSLLVGLLVSFLAAGLCGALFALLTVSLQANQNVTGLTITTFGLGLYFFIGKGLGDRWPVMTSADALVSGFSAREIPLLSSIPVVGKAVSDAMGSVLAGLKMLKGGVGFAAVAVVAAAFLPMMLHCVAYQFFFVALQSVAGALELHRTEKLLGGLGQCAGLLLAMAFFFCFVVVSATMVMILLGNGG